MGANAGDTIVAVATPAGQGGIGVVRLSGPEVTEIARGMLGALPEPRRARLAAFRDGAGEPIDRGIALFFPGPASYTGEDVLELHAHGSPVVLEALVSRAIELGARLARPGEYSERAFLEGRLDLAQAEAVADLIAASSLEAARAALRSMEGELSRRVEALAERLTRLRMHVEATLDFPEEEIDLLAVARVHEQRRALLAALEEVLVEARQGTLLRDGATVVIAGAPNAGKSSLMNALAGAERAIVTEIPGTTRDVLRERVVIGGVPLVLVDTAGLRESSDRVEREGVRRARLEVEKADLLLLVVDHSASGSGAPAICDPQAILAAAGTRLPEGVPALVLLNKMDLLAPEERRFGPIAAGAAAELPRLGISATSGHGLAELRRELLARLGARPSGEGAFTARQRHLDALRRARTALERGAGDRGEHLAELLAEDLREAHDALGEITGRVTPDDLLGRIFAEFCIGK